MSNCYSQNGLVAPLLLPWGVTRKATVGAGFPSCYSCYSHILMNVFIYREREARLGFNRETGVTGVTGVTSPVGVVPARRAQKIQKREYST